MGKTGKDAAPKRAPRRRQAGVTVADVARAAGVSPMTVSRVVNRSESVGDDTRARVEKAIAELGYVPNLAARSLAGGWQCRIALVYGNPSAAYLSEFLAGSLRGASASGVELSIEHRDGGETADALVERLAAHRIDAVLLPPPLCDDARLVAAIAAAGLPLAQVATGAPVEAAHAVTIDDAAAARAMTAHLIGLGHRRIGFIAGSPDQTASGLRLAGFQQALSEAGIAADPALVCEGDFTYRSGLAAAEALLSLPQPPTAIFASNDDMAAAAVSVAHRRGLDVPGDVSICGFDDTAPATTIWPELTTIRQPVAEMAEHAMLVLAEAARAKQDGTPLPGQRRRLDFALVDRASAAPPRG